MILHPVAVASDVDDMAVVHKAVDESSRHHLVAQHAAPVLETLVRRQHSRRLLVPGVDELEEEHGAVLVDRQVADLVDHQQSRMGEHAQPPGQIAGGLGLGEGLDQPRERAVVDAPAGLGRRGSLGAVQNVNPNRKLLTFANRKLLTSGLGSCPQTRCWECWTRCSCG